MTHAVIVAGHAIFKGTDPGHDDAWALLPFQRGEGPCYVEHIRCGVEIAAQDPEALLIFSGGQTRAEAGPRSEAASYIQVAGHYQWWAQTDVAPRTAAEEFALDSYENLLFSLCRFHKLTRTWPARVTLVSWRFKAQRFGLHRAAIRWPESRFAYVGPNDPVDWIQAQAAEALTRAAYKSDPYGASPELRAKKEARNPFRQRHHYAAVSKEVAALLAHAGPQEFGGILPWDLS